MAIAQEKLNSLIVESFPDAKIQIVDLMGDDNHYSVEIIDKSFAGKSRIEQHKMVNKALAGYLGDAAHALHAMKLKTSSE